MLGDAGVESFGDASTRWIARRRSSLLDGPSKIFSSWADTWTIVAGTAGAVFALFPRRAWRSAMTLLVALVVEISAFLSVTYVVDRARPDVEPLSSVPSTGSWPSGHIAAAIVLYGGLALIAWPLVQRRWVRVTAAAVGGVPIPLAVGWSRWYRGLHHPTDLLGGVLLGCVALYVGVLVARRLFPDESAGRAEPAVAVQEARR
ncbi:MAG: phosphatase PAP2 family protein [Mycobacteriales bacterium]